MTVFDTVVTPHRHLLSRPVLCCVVLCHAVLCAEGFEAALDVLGLSGLQKVTARLIDGLDIQHTTNTFTVSFVTVVPFFRVTEEVPLNGGSSQLGRRDLRLGRQTATATTVPGGVRVDMSWGQPLPGEQDLCDAHAAWHIQLPTQSATESQQAHVTGWLIAC